MLNCGIAQLDCIAFLKDHLLHTKFKTYHNVWHFIFFIKQGDSENHGGLGPCEPLSKPPTAREDSDTMVLSGNAGSSVGLGADPMLGS